MGGPISLNSACICRVVYAKDFVGIISPTSDHVKLDQNDARICQRVFDHDIDTGLVAEQFEISSLVERKIASM